MNKKLEEENKKKKDKEDLEKYNNDNVEKN